MTEALSLSPAKHLYHGFIRNTVTAVGAFEKDPGLSGDGSDSDSGRTGAPGKTLLVQDGENKNHATSGQRCHLLPIRSKITASAVGGVLLWAGYS